MRFLTVLPILYNAVQCLVVWYRLLRSLPAAARGFFSLHPDPVGGNVLCSFRKPKFEVHDVLVGLERGRAQANIQSLPFIERQGLGASWMRLINAVGLESQHKKQFQRIVVNSSLDVDPVAMNCGWKSFVFLALGLGVNPMDPALHGLGGGKDAVSEKNLNSTALHSETGQRLIEIRWHEGVPCLELTEQCYSWSVRRSLAQSLHMITIRDGRQEVLHFSPLTNKTWQTPTAKICDCKEIISSPIQFSTLREIHYATTWTFYFEELLHQITPETILIPQSLLLLQFEITEELHQTPTERLHSRISAIFPSDATLTANIMSALTSTWNSSQHQELLNGLSAGAHKSSLENPQRPVSNAIKNPTQSQSQSRNQPLDVEKAIGTSRHLDSPTVSEKPSSSNSDGTTLDLYSGLHSSPIFQSLYLAYSPSAVVTVPNNHPPSQTPTSAALDIGDQSKPEALVVRLVIALSAMRRSTAPRGWVTSIASGALRYKVGPDAGEDMVRKLLGYEGGILSIE